MILLSRSRCAAVKQLVLVHSSIISPLTWAQLHLLACSIRFKTSSVHSVKEVKQQVRQKVDAGRACPSLGSHQIKSLTQRVKGAQQQAQHEIDKDTSYPSLDKRQQPVMQHIALLVDGDHVGAPALQQIVQAVEKHCIPTVRRIYSNAHRASLWTQVVKDCGFDSVIVPKAIGGSKDTVDLALALGAAEVTLQASCLNLSGVAVASEDLDYTIVLRWVRSRGLKAYAVLRDKGYSVGAHETFRNAADELILYTVGQPLQSEFCLVLEVDEFEKASEARRIEYDATPLEQHEMEWLIDVLAELGYVTKAKTDDAQGSRNVVEPLSAAIAKLFHANQLGNLIVSPKLATERQAYVAGQSRHGNSWNRNPGNLTFVIPWRKASAADRRLYGDGNLAMIAAAGGHFLMNIDDDIVKRLLRRLGFLEEQHFQEAVHLFCELNAKRLQGLGFKMESELSLEETMQTLRHIFVAQEIWQYWRVPILDKGVRQQLHVLGYLSSCDEPRQVVFEKMRSFMVKEIGGVYVPETYIMRTTRIMQHLERHQPDVRK